MKKLIIIGHEPLTIRLNKIFCIDQLIKSGVCVEYWDLSQLIFPGINISDKLVHPYIKHICKICELENELSLNNIENCVFVVEIFSNWQNRKILKALSIRNCYCVRVDLYANTTIYKSSFIDKLKRNLSFSIFNSATNVLLCKLYQSLYKITPYKKTASSSSIANRDIAINHPDYEDYYSNNSKNPINIPYILFIDTYYPLHPDLKYYLKIKDPNVNHYREIMKKLFDYLENKYSKKVIIAAHPKSIYSGNEFGQRQIIKNETCNLVKHADLIISHESNSLSFIALSNTPFIFVYPDSYNDSKHLIGYMNQLSAFFQKKTYNIDRCNWDDIVFSPLNKDIRDKYIKNYLTSKECSNKTNSEIIINSLLK